MKNPQDGTRLQDGAGPQEVPPPVPTAPLPGGHRWLVLRLEAPLVAFGGVAIDAVGVTRDFPAASMLTGLFANALGWGRGDVEAHQALQDRLIFAARREWENPAGILTDTQNAQLASRERGWTTWGTPEERGGGDLSAHPHRRRRDYHADACVRVVLRLDDPTGAGDVDPSAIPNLDTLAACLDRPARPLFLGRKSCLPTHPIRQGDIRAANAYTALECLPLLDPSLRGGAKPGPGGRLRALWPVGEGPDRGAMVDKVVAIADRRNWRTGLHGGTRQVVEGWIPSAAPGEKEAGT